MIMKTIIPIILIFFSCSTAKDGQHAGNPVAESINARRYVFKARTMMPASGSSRQLTSDYSFTVKNDTLIAYLPYFGKAYSAAIGRGSDGINFTSTDFTYNVSEGKKGGWLIEMRTKDAGDVQQVNLNVSKNGYGTLHVNNQNRQAISYSGKIEPLK